MGNSMGKKRKLGSASSAKWAAASSEVQAKKEGMSPLGRSYSMPVHHANKPKADNYHVVALTSSTYGILKVDLPSSKDADEKRTPTSTTPTTTMSQGRATKTKQDRENNPNYSSFTFQEKLRKLDIPEIVVPQPWSDVGNIISKFKAASTTTVAHAAQPSPTVAPPSLKAVDEDEPETINMWELMAGLDDESPAKPTVGAKKVRNLETSLSCSAIHSVTEVDADDFLHGATVVKSNLRSSSVASNARSSDPRPPPSGASLLDSSASARTTDSPPAPARKGALRPSSSAFSSSRIPPWPLPNGALDGRGRETPAPNRDEYSTAPTPTTTTASVGDHHSFVRPTSNANSWYNSASSSLSSSASVGATRFGDDPTDETHRKIPKAKPARPTNSSPFGFTTSSSSDDSEDQRFVPESPLFDPDLLASFEKAMEDVSEDEWYRVRRSDADGAPSTSGSSSDADDSPKIPSKNPPSSAPPTKLNTANLTHKTLIGLGESPSARPKKPTEDSPHPKRTSSRVAPVDFRDVVLNKVAPPNKPVDPFERFDSLCPPGGEERVVIYVTSLRGIRKTFEDCSHMKLVVQGYRVAVDERDVSMHADFRQELKDLLGKPMPVPRLFIRGRYIGGSEEMSALHEDGTLAKLLATMPTQTKWEQCDGCGDHRFIPCSECSGSCKVITDDGQVARCPDCNENGLIRCPICY